MHKQEQLVPPSQSKEVDKELKANRCNTNYCFPSLLWPAFSVKPRMDLKISSVEERRESRNYQIYFISFAPQENSSCL